MHRWKVLRIIVLSQEGGSEGWYFRARLSITNARQNLMLVLTSLKLVLFSTAFETQLRMHFNLNEAKPTRGFHIKLGCRTLDAQMDVQLERQTAR